MVNVSNVLSSIRKKPGYTAMRGLARFPVARSAVAGTRRVFDPRRSKILANCEAHMAETAFPNVDRAAFAAVLERDGLSFGLTLPPRIVEEIRAYAAHAAVYADREPAKGFIYAEREQAEQKLGKPILVAQYLNTMRDCPVIAKLAHDPLLTWVAAKYIGSSPTFVGANLWWTSPVHASEEDRNKHAHLFHRDVDDFRFFKYFFYITDVNEGEGTHVCVRGSKTNPPRFKRGDKWNIRRYTDQEINSYYDKADIVDIQGPAGTGFAEDTLCIHKGSTPKTQPRLLLQLQYALFDYRVMSDVHDKAELALL